MHRNAQVVEDRGRRRRARVISSLAPFGFAQGRLWAAFFCRFAAASPRGCVALQSAVLTSSGRIRTKAQLPVAVEQERTPRRRIFTGVAAGELRRYSAVRRASVKTFSFSSPLANFTASTVASGGPAPTGARL